MKLLGSAIAIASILLAFSVPASAHGVLLGSAPAANMSMPASPRQVLVRFSEPLDSALSSAAVFDRGGQRVSARWTVSEGGRALLIPLSPLPRGTYTVKWRALWSSDGHTTSGFFLFAIGEPAPAGPQGGTTQPPDPVRVAVRWVGFAAALFLVGTTVFHLLVLRPGLATGGANDASGTALRTATGALRRLTVLAGAAVILTGLLEFGLQVAQLFDVSLLQVLRGGVLSPFLGETKAGWSLLLRMATATLMLLPTFPWVAGIAGPFLLLSFTLGAHAAGSGIFAGLVDWVHLVAASAWMGGLMSLLTVLVRSHSSDRDRLASLVVPRFSALAGISLGILVVTGLYSTWLHVPGLSAFVTTAYGRTLLVKILLILPLAGLGAFNHFIVRPRLRDDRFRSLVSSRLLKAVTGEVGLGALVLLAVGLLTITPPAAVVAPATMQPLVFGGMARDISLRMTITLARQGWNRLEVQLTGESASLPADNVRLILRLVKLDEDLDPTTVVLQPASDGRYVFEGGELGISGWWELRLVVRRRGVIDDASTSFPLRVGQTALGPDDPKAVRLLQAAIAAMNRLAAWRQVEQITDGSGGVVLNRYAWARPDRLRILSPGTETVVIGNRRFQRIGTDAWEEERLPRPLVVEGALRAFTASPVAVRLGRQEQCEQEECQVVLWDAQGGSVFAAWVGVKTALTHKLMMVAPSHYMTVRFADFDGRIRISPPR